MTPDGSQIFICTNKVHVVTRLHLFFFPFYELQQISREKSALVTTRTSSRLISLLWSSLSNGNAKPPLIFLCLSMRISIPLTFLGPRSGSFSEANSEDLLHFFILSTARSISTVPQSYLLAGEIPFYANTDTGVHQCSRGAPQHTSDLQQV